MHLQGCFGMELCKTFCAFCVGVVHMASMAKSAVSLRCVNSVLDQYRYSVQRLACHSYMYNFCPIEANPAIAYMLISAVGYCLNVCDMLPTPAWFSFFAQIGLLVLVREFGAFHLLLGCWAVLWGALRHVYRPH